MTKDVKSHDFCAAAVALAEKGFHVFPLIAGQKDPTGKRFYERSTNNPQLVRKAWGAGRHNIGIDTGRDVLVLDLDIKNSRPGREDFAIFEALGLDDSVMAATPSGGWHVYLRLPPGAIVGSRSGSMSLCGRTLKGTDARGWHGYVVAPGSVTDSGEYRWIREPRSIDDIPVAPDWIIDMIGRPVERKPDADEPPPLGWDRPEDERRAIWHLYEDAPEAIQGNSGDNTTCAIARDLRDLGLSRAKTLDLMLGHWNEQKAFPPWLPEDLKRKVDNAYHYAKFRAGRLQCWEFEAYEMPEAPVSALGVADRVICGPADTAEKVNSAPPAKASDPDAPEATETRFGKLYVQSFELAIAAAEKSTANWLVKDFLDIGAVSTIYAEPNAGKSFVAAELAHCVATGRQFAGMHVKRGAVLYISLEGAAGFRWRMAALKRYRPTGCDVPLHLLSGEFDLYERAAAVGDLIAAVKAISAATGFPVLLIVVDTLARTMAPGNENETRDMSVVVKRAGQVAAKTGAHVMLIHHSGKDVSKGARGSGALRAGIDTELEIKADERKPNEPASGRIIVRKQREYDYIPPIKFRLRKVDAGVTADLETKTSCVVDFPIIVEKNPEADLSPPLRAALDALRSIAPNGEAVTAGAWDRALSKVTSEHTKHSTSKYRLRLRELGLVSLESRKKWRVNVGEFTPSDGHEKTTLSHNPSVTLSHEAKLEPYE